MIAAHLTTLTAADLNKTRRLVHDDDDDTRYRRRSCIELTDEQRAALAAIERAVNHSKDLAVLGLAGSGKTTIASEVAISHPGAYLCAPTAKAASVLTAKTGASATTVHAAFYEFFEDEAREGKPPELLLRPKHGRGWRRGAVLLLDECSMISRETAADIIATGITIIAFGDPGQLPPVEGDSFFTKASVTLTEIHRQALESPIIRQAHSVRSSGSYAPDGDAVRVINKLTANDLRAADVVLTGRRSTRMRMNGLIRQAHGITSPLPRLGEPLICLRNTRKHGLCNGAVYYASRDVQEDDKTIGISTDAGDVEVHAGFFGPATNTTRSTSHPAD